MPPLVKITKEMLICQATKQVLEKGFSSITARSLAKEISCSTQPIYSCFHDIEELKKEVYDNLVIQFTEEVISKVDDSVDFFESFTHSFLDYSFSGFSKIQVIFFSDFYNFDIFYEFLIEKFKNMNIFGKRESFYSIDNNKKKDIFNDVLTYLIGLFFQKKNIFLSFKENFNNDIKQEKDKIYTRAELCIKAILSFSML